MTSDIAPCTCGAPAVLDTRPGYKFPYAIHCSKRGRGMGRAGTAGCTVMPIVTGIYRQATINKWNREATGKATEYRDVGASVSGERCPRCFLLLPHANCLKLSAYRSGEAVISLRGRMVYG